MTFNSQKFIERWLNSEDATGRMYRALADYSLRPAKLHFVQWQRHKRNQNIAMMNDHEQMMWHQLFYWAEFDCIAKALKH